MNQNAICPQNAGLNIFQRTELKIQQLHEQRREAELIAIITPRGDNSATSPRIKKTDLVRMAVHFLKEESETFTFIDIHDILLGAINRQTISALTNRLYVTDELGCETKDGDRCMNYYATSKLRSAPEWMASLGLNAAVAVFIANECEAGPRNHESDEEPELVCSEVFIEFSNNWFQPKKDISILL